MKDKIIQIFGEVLQIEIQNFLVRQLPKLSNWYYVTIFGGTVTTKQLLKIEELLCCDDILFWYSNEGLVFSIVFPKVKEK